MDLEPSLRLGAFFGIFLAAVIVFEVVLNGMAMFSHANLRMRPGLERRLRWLLVTPDMHRVHHSVDPAEHDTKYSFNRSVWDRLFRTHVPDPARGHEGMTIGLEPCQNENPARLGWSLALPFFRR